MTEPNWTLQRRKKTLAKRAEILDSIRRFFQVHGYLEVETPHRIPVNAPEPHIDPVASGAWVMHTSPELAMKRLLAAGYDKVFQICRVWREAERGQKHLPEFTMLEWYRAESDYHQLMDECEALLQALVPGRSITYRGKTIDVSPPWERLTVAEAFARHATKSLEESISADIYEEILTSQVEPNLGQGKPTFLIEYPASMAALARSKPGDPTVAERFELYINGVELANAFSELTDPEEQHQRFLRDEAFRRSMKKPAQAMPEPFLSALQTMPPAAGIALGVDRLVMLLTDAAEIDEVVAFTPEEL